jgi:FRG domain
MPIDRVSGNATTWDEVKKNYPPDVTVPNYAETHWKVAGDKIDVSWRTDAGTHGSGIVEKSKGYLDSTLMPVAEINTWEDFRRFTRELEPYRYIFRGQTSNKWRLRTSFHRTGRASLVKFMLQDIPVLHRHLSGMMAHHLDLRDPLQNAAFYNLVQHHGYPTPLLDWTYSPFIGAYFAYKGVPRSGMKPEDRVRLFVFDKLRWCQEFETIGLVAPAKLHFTVLEPLALNNPRVVPQQSVSSVTNIEDIEAYLTNRENQVRKQYLRVIDLPASERNAVMQELSLMGITAGSLFPGVDGACEQVRERFFPA